MNQKKFAVWMIVIFLLISCTSNLPETSNFFTEQVSEINGCPDSEIVILGNTSAAPGESVSLAISPVGLNWQYQWIASVGNFSTASESVTTFTVPEIDGSVTVSVIISFDGACEDVRVTKSIDIINPPTFTPNATNTVLPTNTPTFTVAPTDTPTVGPSATNTLEPTVAFTSTPFYTPTPSQTPSPTVPSFAILLKEPKDETCVGSDNAVFEWLATRPLNNIEGANGEYFALNIWAEGSPVYSVSWIKNPRYEIENISDPIAVYTQLVNCSGESGCFWNVDLIVSKVDKGSGHLPESFTKLYSSPQRWFCTEIAPPPIPPTNTPEPPILATPNDESCPPDC
jgi:hypothetical protein